MFYVIFAAIEEGRGSVRKCGYLDGWDWLLQVVLYFQELTRRKTIEDKKVFRLNHRFKTFGGPSCSKHD